MFRTLCITIFILIALQLEANDSLKSTQDTVRTSKSFKNTFKYNISNPAVFNPASIIFGYERTIGKNQSISFEFGKLSLASLFSSDSFIKGQTFQMVNAGKETEKGVHFAVEYRFYPKKENKYNSPRGIYFAPYYSYNHFEKENYWNITSGTINGELVTKTNLTTNAVGMELGYQFVIKKRLAIDCILFGPGVAHYNFKADVSTSLSPEDQQIVYDKIEDAIQSVIPGYSLVVPNNEFAKTGNVRMTGGNMRFMIHLGFRF